MAITQTSRYAASKVAPVTDARGVTRQTILPTTPADTAYQVGFYQWRHGDRPDLLAYRNYGDERLWWLIAKVNPEINDWLHVPVGTVIRIPVA
jgi:nucleoid-associated protein YgaU